MLFQPLLIRAEIMAKASVQRLGSTPERGDVPGWVLVTLMTAGLVVALWAIAGPMLEQTFTDAIKSVQGP